MADPNNPNYAFGATRHVADPNSQLSDPTTMAKSVNRWSQARGPSPSDVNGTGSLLSGVKHKSPKSAGGMPALGNISSPLSLDNSEGIATAAGIGKIRQGNGIGDEAAMKMSDADAPTQTTTTGLDGSVMHHRLNGDGSVTSRGIGAYAPPDLFTEPI